VNSSGSTIGVRIGFGGSDIILGFHIGSTLGHSVSGEIEKSFLSPIMFTSSDKVSSVFDHEFVKFKDFVVVSLGTGILVNSVFKSYIKGLHRVLTSLTDGGIADFPESGGVF